MIIVPTVKKKVFFISLLLIGKSCTGDPLLSLNKWIYATPANTTTGLHFKERSFPMSLAQRSLWRGCWRREPGHWCRLPPTPPVPWWGFVGGALWWGLLFLFRISISQSIWSFCFLFSCSSLLILFSSSLIFLSLLSPLVYSLSCSSIWFVIFCTDF